MTQHAPLQESVSHLQGHIANLCSTLAALVECSNHEAFGSTLAGSMSETRDSDVKVRHSAICAESLSQSCWIVIS